MAENLKTGGAKSSGSASIALPGQKLATSKIPRTLTPSEIELLQQDLKAALKVLGQDETDDAHSLLREYAFRSADFEILLGADPSLPSQGATKGSVVVLRRRNGYSRSYSAGHGSSWLQQLETDLKQGAFGPPE